MKIDIIAIILIVSTLASCVFLSVSVSALFTSTQNSSSASVLSAVITSRVICGSQIINWTLISGCALNPNTTITQLLTITNPTNQNLILHMDTRNFNPSEASDSLKINWNCENFALAPQESISSLIALQVLNQISSEQVTFDIIIAGGSAFG